MCAHVCVCVRLRLRLRLRYLVFIHAICMAPCNVLFHAVCHAQPAPQPRNLKSRNGRAGLHQKKKKHPGGSSKAQGPIQWKGSCICIHREGEPR